MSDFTIIKEKKNNKKWWHNAVIYQVYPKVSRIVMAMYNGGLKGINEQARLSGKARDYSHLAHQSTRVPWMITAMTSRITRILPHLVPWKIWKKLIAEGQETQDQNHQGTWWSTIPLRSMLGLSRREHPDSPKGFLFGDEPVNGISAFR